MGSIRALSGLDEGGGTHPPSLLLCEILGKALLRPADEIHDTHQQTRNTTYKTKQNWVGSIHRCELVFDGVLPCGRLSSIC